MIFPNYIYTHNHIIILHFSHILIDVKRNHTFSSYYRTTTLTMEASQSYYSVLGLNNASSTDDIRRAYRKLAMQWHPDKWANNPAMLGEVKQRFQKIQEAYSVLSDPRKRTLYDMGMYDPIEEVDEGLCDFMQELLSLMSQVGEEEKNSTMEDLQSMCAELVQGFQSPQWFYSQSVARNQGCSGILQQEAESIRHDSSTPSSSFGVFGMSNYCR